MKFDFFECVCSPIFRDIELFDKMDSYRMTVIFPNNFTNQAMIIRRLNLCGITDVHPDENNFYETQIIVRSKDKRALEKFRNEMEFLVKD